MEESTIYEIDFVVIYKVNKRQRKKCEDTNNSITCYNVTIKDNQKKTLQQEKENEMGCYKLKE